MSSNTTWEESAKAKKQSVLDLIPQEWRIPDPIPSIAELRDVTPIPRRYLSEREIQITESDAEAIVNETSTGRWKAEEVARAFAHRAALAHQLVNCLHEIFFDAAIEDAKKLDAYFEEHHAPIGPLHGLPISLKDQLHVKDVETTMGYVGWIGTFQGKKGTGKEKVFESEMVRELRNLGAVLYCKTSVPYTLMIGETQNNIIGYTYNPKNRNLSAGGSSGGEGALIALRGSVLGFGTDIGGSIRIPAGFCGQYGLKPSGGRMPYEGLANSLDGQNTILSVIGPLSSSIGGLRLATKSVLSQEPWLHDPLVHEIPWRTTEDAHVRDNTGSLTFGVLRDDRTVTPFPPVARAIEELLQVLNAAGNQVLDWEPPSHMEGNRVLMTAFGYDHGADIRRDRNLSGEPLNEMLENAYGTERAPPDDASFIMQNNIAKREYQKKYMDYWNSTASLTKTGRPVDAFIMPVASYPAAQPGKYHWYGYTNVVNALDYTAAVVPVTFADKKVDLPVKNHTPLSKHDNYETYDPELWDGAYVSLQIVARRLQEEKVLAVAEYVDQLLQKRSKSGSRL